MQAGLLDVQHPKKNFGAYISNGSLHSKSEPENAVSCQYVITPVKIRAHKHIDVNFLNREVGSMQAYHVLNHLGSRKKPSNNLLSRLLLFPNHYFW